MSSQTPRRCVPGAQGPGCSRPLYAPMKEFKVIDMCGYFSFLNNNKFLTHALLWTSFSVLNLIDYSERRIHDIRTLLRWCKKSSLGHRTGPRLDFLISLNWPFTVIMLGDDVMCLKVPPAKPNAPVCMPVGHLPNLAILNPSWGPIALHPCDNSSTSNCN